MKRKRNTLILLLILVVLATIALVSIFKDRSTTLSANARNFAVEDTASVTRIIMSDKNGGRAELVRQPDNTWKINEKYKAAQNRVNILLETIKRVEVKSPVPLSARDNVIRAMAGDAVKVEVYQNGKLARTYFVGGTTPDELGTLMLVDGAEDPFVTHIPGFVGYLNTRYYTDVKEWRTRELYAINPTAIQEVDVQYPGSPESSFRFVVQGDEMKVTPLAGNSAESLTPSSIEGKRFLTAFKSMHFDDFATVQPQVKDSILRETPFVVINVKAQGYDVPELRLFLKRSDVRNKAEDPGEPVDQMQMYGVLGNAPTELFIAQRYVVGKILYTFGDWRATPAQQPAPAQ